MSEEGIQNIPEEMQVDPNKNEAIEAKEIVALGNRSITSEADLGRYACSFCFCTLNPQDSREEYRSFVKYDGRIFHEHCWKEHKPHEGAEAEPVSISLPHPLEEMSRQAVLLYGGPINSLSDTPLGLSVGTVSFDSRQNKAYESFIIRNNQERQAVVFPRSLGPIWVYIDFGNYAAISDKMALRPSEAQQVDIYPHPARPSFHQAPINLNDRQSILLVTDAFVPSFLLSIGVLVFLGLAYWFNFSQWVSQLGIYVYYDYAITEQIRDWFTRSSLTTVIVFTALFSGWLAFMMPSHLLWFGFSLVEKLKQTTWLKFLDGLFTKLEDLIWQQFAYRRIVSLYTSLGNLLIVALVAGLIMGILSIPIWLVFGLILMGLANIFGGLATTAVFLAHTVILVLATAVLFEFYGLQFFAIVRRLLNFGFQQAKSLANKK